MSEENHLIADRKQKIADWKSLGYAPYAKDFDRTHTAAQATQYCENNQLREASEIMTDLTEPLTEHLEDSGKELKSVAGRIVAMREMGKLAFLSIRDVSGDFQICLAKDLLGDNYKALLKALDLGDFAGFKGECFKTKHGEPTLMAIQVTPLSKSLRPLPEKWHGLSDKEACYRERNLDLISNKDTFERFKTRSKVVKEVRNFYEARDFMEVETSILSAQAGGAMAKTFMTHHNALDHNFHLRIALELPLKIVCSGGIERVFEIGKCFRNEGTDPSHLQEFTMLEWYAAYVSFEQNLEWNETMLREIAQNVFGKTNFTVKDKFDTEHEIDFAKPFAKRKFADLLKEYADFDMFTATDDEVRAKATEVGVDQVEGVGRANLLDDIYKKTARPLLIQPTFVLDYPEDLKPLAAPNGDGTASCFQVLIAGWEVINAYGELIDPQIQRALLEKQAGFKAGGDDEAMEVDEVFLKAMEHGFPPMAGQGMGIDRIVSLLTGQDNLRDVVLFPTLKPDPSFAKASKGKSKETMLATAIINTDLVEEDWQALNSVGHLCAAFGAREGDHLFFQDEITTKDGNAIKLNTTQAIMIKSSNDNQALIELAQLAKLKGLQVAEFTREMLETSDDRNVANLTAGKDLNEIDFYGVLVFGKKSTVEQMTAKFELLKSLASPCQRGTKGDLTEKKKSPQPSLTRGSLNESHITRDQAWSLVKEKCDWALQRHLAHVAASMEALAIDLGHEDQKDTWYITGLLHDIDWNQTINDPELHCAQPTMDYLAAHGVSQEIRDAIQAHCQDVHGVPADTDLKRALLAVDELSGFAVAVALLRPTKMDGMTPKSIVKKIKDKGFAAAVDRQHMKFCEDFFNKPVSEFLQILIPAWEAIAADWELKA
ncbi:lysine--tRNA ligase [bacterium]|nr:lysine--tRNA ligase [bacterium]NCQ55255.1 lysine--tRNA ligase [Candidatus Parcubacteria bacterium]NCS67232.1 lysine--tRNA ligase [Candidatus Peregrinibacteria bacterium]NCS96487.1 lysine--tRNA ligase [bacterium]